MCHIYGCENNYVSVDTFYMCKEHYLKRCLYPFCYKDKVGVGGYCKNHHKIQCEYCNRPEFAYVFMCRSCNFPTYACHFCLNCVTSLCKDCKNT